MRIKKLEPKESPVAVISFTKKELDVLNEIGYKAHEHYSVCLNADEVNLLEELSDLIDGLD